MAFFYDHFSHWSGTSGSRRPAPRSHGYRVRSHTAVPEGTSSCGIPFSLMRCHHRGAAGLWPPRHPHPHPPPRGSGVRTELESRPYRTGTVCNQFAPAVGRTQACHAHLASAENRSPETGLKRNLGLVSEGHLTGVGRPVLWMRRSGFRNPAVGLSGLGGPHSTCRVRCA